MAMAISPDSKYLAMTLETSGSLFTFFTLRLIVLELDNEQGSSNKAPTTLFSDSYRIKAQPNRLHFSPCSTSLVLEDHSSLREFILVTKSVKKSKVNLFLTPKENCNDDGKTVIIKKHCPEWKKHIQVPKEHLRTIQFLMSCQEVNGEKISYYVGQKPINQQATVSLYALIHGQKGGSFLRELLQIIPKLQNVELRNIIELESMQIKWLLSTFYLKGQDRKTGRLTIVYKQNRHTEGKLEVYEIAVSDLTLADRLVSKQRLGMSKFALVSTVLDLPSNRKVQARAKVCFSYTFPLRTRLAQMLHSLDKECGSSLSIAWFTGYHVLQQQLVTRQSLERSGDGCDARLESKLDHLFQECCCNIPSSLVSIVKEYLMSQFDMYVYHLNPAYEILDFVADSKALYLTCLDLFNKVLFTCQFEHSVESVDMKSRSFPSSPPLPLSSSQVFIEIPLIHLKGLLDGTESIKRHMDHLWHMDHDSGILQTRSLNGQEVHFKLDNVLCFDLTIQSMVCARHSGQEGDWRIELYSVHSTRLDPDQRILLLDIVLQETFTPKHLLVSSRIVSAKHAMNNKISMSKPVPRSIHFIGTGTNPMICIVRLSNSRIYRMRLAHSSIYIEPELLISEWKSRVRGPILLELSEYHYNGEQASAAQDLVHKHLISIETYGHGIEVSRITRDSSLKVAKSGQIELHVHRRKQRITSYHLTFLAERGGRWIKTRSKRESTMTLKDTKTRGANAKKLKSSTMTKFATYKLILVSKQNWAILKPSLDITSLK